MIKWPMAARLRKVARKWRLKAPRGLLAIAGTQVERWTK